MKTTLIIAALAFSAGALAQEPSKPPSATTPGTSSPSNTQMPTFESLDKNLDGRLTSTEVQGTSLASKFATIDKQGKGYLTREEYQSYLKSDTK